MRDVLQSVLGKRNQYFMKWNLELHQWPKAPFGVILILLKLMDEKMFYRCRSDEFA